ncbi:hypothetical protein [Ferruginibacter sp.]|nr:hypothetical protein [Ferruginibacter sp.]
MKKVFIISNFILVFICVSRAQDSWGIYINISNTNIINKDANYAKTAFNSIGDFAEREPFYGNFIKKLASWHKSFGLWYKIPLEKGKTNYYLLAGVSTYGHKEELNGGKSEDYPYGLSFNSLPPGDSNISISNKYYNYFFNLGAKVELKFKKRFFSELQVNYSVNKNNHNEVVKTFRSVFSSLARTKTGASNQGKDIAYNDVNYMGILFLQGGINCKIIDQLKLHLLYSISLTPVNKYTEIKKLYYRGIALQLSYSVW